MLRGLPKFVQQRPGSFRAWLRTIAVNKWHDRQRQEIPLPIGPEDDRLEAMPAMIRPSNSKSQRSHPRSTGNATDSLRLSPNGVASFLRATTVENRPVGEVAAELMISPNAIYVGRSRILQRLRTELAGLLGTDQNISRGKDSAHLVLVLMALLATSRMGGIPMNPAATSPMWRRSRVPVGTRSVRGAGGRCPANRSGTRFRTGRSNREQHIVRPCGRESG